MMVTLCVVVRCAIGQVWSTVNKIRIRNWNARIENFEEICLYSAFFQQNDKRK